MSSFYTVPVSAKHVAGQVVARGLSRAQKMRNSINPHGPAVSKESLRRRRHSDHAGGTGSEDGVDVTDAAVTYTISVSIGSPPTLYNLLIDTGNLPIVLPSTNQ